MDPRHRAQEAHADPQCHLRQLPRGEPPGCINGFRFSMGRHVCGSSNPVAEVRETSCGALDLEHLARLPTGGKPVSTRSDPAAARSLTSAGLCVSFHRHHQSMNEMKKTTTRMSLALSSSPPGSLRAKTHKKLAALVVRGMLRRPSVTDLTTVMLCSVHIHNKVAKKLDEEAGREEEAEDENSRERERERKKSKV